MKFPVYLQTLDFVHFRHGRHGREEIVFAVNRPAIFTCSFDILHYVWTSRIKGYTSTATHTVPIYSPCPLLLGWKGDMNAQAEIEAAFISLFRRFVTFE